MYSDVAFVFFLYVFKNRFTLLIRIVQTMQVRLCRQNNNQNL